MKITFSTHTPAIARIRGFALDPKAYVAFGAVASTVEQNDQAP